MFQKNFTLLKNPSNWRRVSIANWNAPNDPTVYAQLSVDFGACNDYLKKINANSSVKVTPTHMVAKACALILKKFPDLNGIIRWKRIYLRKTVDIFLQVAIEAAGPNEKADLSGAKVSECDKKTLIEIASELKDKANAIRARKDPHLQKTMGLFNKIPAFLLSFVVRFASFLIYNFDVHLPSLGLLADPFGSAMVTSVGMFQMAPGFAPLVPASRCPLIICLGEVKDKPWVVDHQIVIRPIADMCITFDHRFIDGLTGSRMARYLQEILKNPDLHFES